jgi:hypothetical protein
MFAEFNMGMAFGKYMLNVWWKVKLYMESVLDWYLLNCSSLWFCFYFLLELSDSGTSVSENSCHLEGVSDQKVIFLILVRFLKIVSVL